MGKFSQYNIPLRSLSDGKHEFVYHLDSEYFKLLNDDSLDIKKGELDVNVSVKKTANAFELNFFTKGQIQVPCDRCLDNIAMEVETKNKLVVKFGNEYSEESDEIVVIPETDGAINIAWFLYEFISLSLPIKKVHPAGECNKTMSSKLKKHRVTSDDDGDLDLADEDDSDLDVTDSRWDALKDLQLDD